MEFISKSVMISWICEVLRWVISENYTFIWFSAHSTHQTKVSQKTSRKENFLFPLCMASRPILPTIKSWVSEIVNMGPMILIRAFQTCCRNDRPHRHWRYTSLITYKIILDLSNILRQFWTTWNCRYAKKLDALAETSYWIRS